MSAQFLCIVHPICEPPAQLMEPTLGPLISLLNFHAQIWRSCNCLITVGLTKKWCLLRLLNLRIMFLLRCFYPPPSPWLAWPQVHPHRCVHMDTWMVLTRVKLSLSLSLKTYIYIYIYTVYILPVGLIQRARLLLLGPTLVHNNQGRHDDGKVQT